VNAAMACQLNRGASLMFMSQDEIVNLFYVVAYQKYDSNSLVQ
jgi:hypothetical protein